MPFIQNILNDNLQKEKPTNWKVSILCKCSKGKKLLNELKLQNVNSL